MQRLHLLRIIAAAASLTLPAAASAQQSRAPRATTAITLDTLRWMSGCWRGDAGQNTAIEEQYTTPATNQILGLTRYLRNGRSVNFEFTSITAESARVILRAQPRGVPPTPFTLDSLSPTFARWSNPHHDFPQRIMYRQLHRDTLTAKIAGPDENGSQQEMEWRLVRQPCSA